MNKKQLLLIFIKNEVKGKVKTRLAATLGPDKALEVYRALLDKTCDVVHALSGVDKRVYYSDEVVTGDRWDLPGFTKAVQHPGDLGQRMTAAFQKGFEDGYEQVCIIGSDCWDLTTDRLQEAFAGLSKNDFVAGAANDGGYYLLGMTFFLEALFKGKTFSTDSVYKEALNEIVKAGKQVHELGILTDIDNEGDLKGTALWPQLMSKWTAVK